MFPRALEQKYVDALRAEIAGHAWEWRPETVYFGGGTPSQMDEAALSAVLAGVPGRPWQEATMEAAPGGVTPERAEAWRRLGIDRVSLGVQSFAPRELARTGRRHTAEVVAREVAVLAEHGISNVNIDLIAGLPLQTMESWGESLAWVERLGAPHVSVYMLEIDEDSRLGREAMAGGARYGAADLPSEALTVEMYERAIEALRDMGIEQYEISNFARPGYESRHNLKYWHLQPYAGFGADAHSFDGRVRRQNVETPAEYVGRFDRGEPPCAAATEARPEEERFFVGLRLREGIRPEREEWRRFEGPIRRFMDEGLLEAEGGALRLTRRGVLLSNEVFQEFLAL